MPMLEREAIRAERHFSIASPAKRNLAIWHPQRESNSQLTLRRGLLYPFNYAGILPLDYTPNSDQNQEHSFDSSHTAYVLV